MLDFGNGHPVLCIGFLNQGSKLVLQLVDGRNAEQGLPALTFTWKLLDGQTTVGTGGAAQSLGDTGYNQVSWQAPPLREGELSR